MFHFKSPAQVVVDVNGEGYELNISLHTYGQIQQMEQGQLHTFLQVKEDSHTLFGFFEQGEKDLFIQLLSVSGVGASTARMMLSSVRPDELVRAIVQGNKGQLEAIKGIGKKSAERIILELRDKLAKTQLPVTISTTVSNSFELDALNALVALGIGRPLAEQAVRQVVKNHPELDQVEDVIKKALKSL
jgi:Holliday junction DNA helicase RuvA